MQTKTNDNTQIISKSKMDEILESGDFRWQIYLAALSYIESGLYVLPIVKDGKSLPPSKYSINYGSASRKKETIEKWFHPETGKFSGWNIGIATGKEGGVFVVDVDGEIGKEQLQNLEAENEQLPKGPVQSTPGGGLHHIFQWQDNASSSTGKLARNIDTRGGTDKACKGHIVAFPSKRGDKRYKWESGGEIPYIPQWVMQKMGVSWRGPSSMSSRGNENIGDDDLEKQVPVDQVERMLKCIDIEELEYEEWLRVGMAIKSQYPGDDGLKLWDKWSSNGSRYKKNECATRWNGFSDSGTVRIGTLFYFAKEHGWEATEEDVIGNKYDFLVEKMNQTFAITVTGGKIKVIREKDSNFDPTIGHYDLMGKDDFRTLLQNDTIRVFDAKGNPKLVSVADIWLGHSARRTYPNGMGLFPDGAPEGWYNTWDGFSVKPIKGDCSKFLNHIKHIITDGNKGLYEWVLDWCADAVQEPSDPKGTAIVMRGEEGIGKGTLANTMGELFGVHFRHLIDDAHLVSNFNAHMMDALFVFADEITWGGNKKTAGKLKGLVTEKHLLGERKGVDAFGYRNMIRIMIASNNDWVIPAGPGSRRWLVLDVPQTMKGNLDYFNDILNELDNGGREAFLYFLLNRKIKNSLREAPYTESLQEQRIRSAAGDSVLRWWTSKLESGEIGVQDINDVSDDDFDSDEISDGNWPSVVIKSNLYDNYEKYCLDRRMQPEMSNIFGKMMLRYGVTSGRINKGGTKKYVYKIPTMDEAKLLLKKVMGIDLDKE